MKRIIYTLAVPVLFVATAYQAQGSSQLELSNTINSGSSKTYRHEKSILLRNGFWAKSGSDVTASVSAPAGYYLDTSPLDTIDKQYTSNDGRTYIVAGCVPKVFRLPPFPAGSYVRACNDLDEAKDKVVESKFISCLDYFPNGVLQGVEIKEVNNRTWQSFRFICRDLQADGTLSFESRYSDYLFDYEKEGKLYKTTTNTDKLTAGILEFWNQLQLRQSLLTIALIFHGADEVQDAGERNRQPEDFKFTDRIPPSSPALVNHFPWRCPPGMVVSGAAIGHVPKNNERHTRPTYILAECRKLFHN